MKVNDWEHFLETKPHFVSNFYKIMFKIVKISKHYSILGPIPQVVHINNVSAIFVKKFSWTWENENFCFSPNGNGILTLHKHTLRHTTHMLFLPPKLLCKKMTPHAPLLRNPLSTRRRWNNCQEENANSARYISFYIEIVYICTQISIESVSGEGLQLATRMRHAQNSRAPL
jgi:hypothetical protein